MADLAVPAGFFSSASFGLALLSVFAVVVLLELAAAVFAGFAGAALLLVPTENEQLVNTEADTTTRAIISDLFFIAFSLLVPCGYSIIAVGFLFL